MGEAKRRRDAAGVRDERSARDVDAAEQLEIRCIERHRNGTALVQRRRGIGIDTGMDELQRWVDGGGV